MARVAVTGLDEIEKGFSELLGMRDELCRAMGVAMGQVVRDEAKERAPLLQPDQIGVDNQRPGLLKESIYLAYDGRRSVLNKQTVYTVSWNSKKAPHGHLVEFGHWMSYQWARLPSGQYYTPISTPAGKKARAKGIPLANGGFQIVARPFLGPAFDAKLPLLNGIASKAGKAKFEELSK